MSSNLNDQDLVSTLVNEYPDKIVPAFGQLFASMGPLKVEMQTEQ